MLRFLLIVFISVTIAFPGFAQELRPEEARRFIFDKWWV
jgi:hypothetical protein